ncbi:MAG: hypothetical protein Q9187_001809 [Circinaria calcarea]
MFNDISLIRGHNFRDYSDQHLKHFLHVLRAKPTLGRYVRSVAANMDNSSIEVLKVLFCLPVIHTLWISHFNNCYAPTLPKNAGASRVKVLRLLHCGAHENALTEILSWPKALEELCYEVDQGEWSGQFAGETLPQWDSAAFVRALGSQKDSLKHLSMTRRWQYNKGMPYNPPIDFSNFTALTFLRLFHVFLVGVHFGPAKNIHEKLPAQLEQLEVYYDDAPHHRFVEVHELGWLTVMALLKPTHLPALQAVAIFSPERLGEIEGDEENHGAWVPPSCVSQAFEQAGIALSIDLQYPLFPGLLQT